MMDGNLPPPGLNTQLFEQSLRKMVSGGITYAVTTKHLDLADAEIDEVGALRDRLAAFLDNQFDYMMRNARDRARNQRLLADYDYKLVSLGTDCLSRTIPTRWGLKPPKAHGERTHPFDLAVHPYEALCQVLDDDFATYLDTSQLMVNVKTYVYHKQLKIHFNHELGDKYAENDFAYFKEFYSRRIRNFREDVADHPVLFVLHMTTEHVPVELYEILNRRLLRDDWQLLVINTAATPYEPAAAAAAPPRMLLHHIPYPYAGFVWHLTPHFTTPEGQAFERRVVAAARAAIIEGFPRRT